MLRTQRDIGLLALEERADPSKYGDGGRGGQLPKCGEERDNRRPKALLRRNGRGTAQDERGETVLRDLVALLELAVFLSGEVLEALERAPELVTFCVRCLRRRPE